MNNKPVIPASIWALGFVSLLMDVSSELIHSLLPVFLSTVLGGRIGTHHRPHFGRLFIALLLPDIIRFFTGSFGRTAEFRSAPLPDFLLTLSPEPQVALRDRIAGSPDQLAKNALMFWLAGDNLSGFRLTVLLQPCSVPLSTAWQADYFRCCCRTKSALGKSSTHPFKEITQFPECILAAYNS